MALPHSTDPRGPGRRILLAAYYFPPDAAVGGLRMAKFARYLGEFGWEPHVLTASDDLRDPGLDPERCTGLEAISTVRTGELPRWVERIGRLKSVLGRRRGVAETTDAFRAVPSRLQPETVARKLKRWAVSLLVLLPDEKKNWSLRAAVTAVTLIRQRKIDWILTSGPPFSTHVIGCLARAVTRARWIADFRDPWIDLLVERFPHTRSRASDAIERWMESMVVHSADRILTTTERMRAAMVARYPDVPVERFVSIPNSIDTDRIPRVGIDDDLGDRLTITYAGSLYFDRTPEPLFAAVSRLIAAGQATAADIRIRLIGDCHQSDGVETSTLVRRYGLDDVVDLHGRLPYAEAVGMMQRSHLLLVLAPERHRLVVPAKMYDYLGTGRTILALAEPGATADLVNEMQSGRCFAHADVEGLRNYLAELLESGSYQTLRNEPGRFARYDARSLTGALADELDRVQGTPTPEVMVRT